MKVLITGGDGFIARSLTEALATEHEIVACNRQQLELLDGERVATFIKQDRFDAVIHAATYDAAPSFSTKDPKLVLENNLKMFFHIARCSDHFGKMIYFGSGAEFSRPHWKPKMSEDYFDQHVPEDQYGLSKYVMTKHALQSKNIYNLRLFGLFGKYDDWRYRFIPNACARAVLNLPITINQNKRFDFLLIDDLAPVVRWVIQGHPKNKVYHVCSGTTYEFKTLAEMILKISGKKLDIVIKKDGFGGEYSGDNTRLLDEMKGVTFTPLESAIAQLYTWYEDHRSIIKPEDL
ncbi:MAG TPA: NAD(P)-dependent oxidoreductase [Candidatus Bathyarchaeia archaeon]|nr:NAD(P)-dependent oxidoreductase [Candidatus Bathyarchaeia archaeon]